MYTLCTVSFSAIGLTGFNYGTQRLFLYKNGDFLPESLWFLTTNDGASDFIGLTSSRIVVSVQCLGIVAWKLSNVKLFQILHMDVGDTLDLRLTLGDAIQGITLNIAMH